jgi:hypothetical protein
MVEQPESFLRSHDHDDGKHGYKTLIDCFTSGEHASDGPKLIEREQIVYAFPSECDPQCPTVNLHHGVVSGYPLKLLGSYNYLHKSKSGGFIPTPSYEFNYLPIINNIIYIYIYISQILFYSKKSIFLLILQNYTIH